MRVREADLVKRNGDLEIKCTILEENIHHVHAIIDAIYEHMNTLTVDDWKAERKWEEYKLIIESMHHLSSQMKEKKVACTRDRKRS